MSNYYSDSTSYSTSISLDDAAYEFLENQSNKSGTIRTLLNDAVKICKDTGDYMMLSESERLRKYFNYAPKPTPEQIRAAMLERIDSTQADETARHRLAVIARYIHQWRKYADHLVSVEHQQYAVGFIVHCADEYISGGEAEAPDIAFAVQLKAFLKACEAGNIEAYAASTKRLDRAFIKVVLVLFDAWDLVSEEPKQLIHSAPDYENIVSKTLEYLRDYYAEQRDVSAYSLEMDYLHQLSCRYVHKPEQTRQEGSPSPKERDDCERA